MRTRVKAKVVKALRDIAEEINTNYHYQGKINESIPPEYNVCLVMNKTWHHLRNQGCASALYDALADMTAPKSIIEWNDSHPTNVVVEKVLDYAANLEAE